MNTAITRSDAEAVVAAIVNRWPDAASSAGSPNLRDPDHEGLDPGCWSIDWEGSVDDWTIHFTGAVSTGAVALPVGVFAEPINGCILGLYPDEVDEFAAERADSAGFAHTRSASPPSGVIANARADAESGVISIGNGAVIVENAAPAPWRYNLTADQQRELFGVVYSWLRQRWAHLPPAQESRGDDRSG